MCERSGVSLTRGSSWESSFSLAGDELVRQGGVVSVERSTGHLVFLPVSKWKLFSEDVPGSYLETVL